MHPSSRRTVTPRRFAWLLWLALLLPIAQATAAGHAFSHLGTPAESSELDGKKALAQHADCALCVVAAAMGAGALPSTPPTWPHLAAGHEEAQVLFISFAPGPLVRAYHSRAPPSSRC